MVKTTSLTTLLKHCEAVWKDQWNLPHITHRTDGNYVYAAYFTDITRAKKFAKVINENLPFHAVVEEDRVSPTLYVDQAPYVVGIRKKEKVVKK